MGEALKAIWKSPQDVKGQSASASICGNNRVVFHVGGNKNQHDAFGPVDPVDAIEFRMERQGLTTRDLEPYIGPSGRVSEVLDRKRPSSLRMVKQLHEGLRIPCESLLAGT